MSVDNEILVRIQRIQRKFQEGLSSEKRLKYLQYLSGISISLDILKETSIGKTVNLMRKEDGMIGQMAAELYLKWKEVAASEYGGNTSSKQQTMDKNIYNKNVDNNSSRHSTHNHSNSSISNENSSCSQLANGTLKTTKEYTSSSSPCKPKVNGEKPKKLKIVSSTHDNDEKTLAESSWHVKVEPSSSRSDSPVPASKLNSEKLDKKKTQKNEKIVKKEDSPSKDDTGSADTPKKKQNMSFGEMLMMPIYPTKKKKKKKTETAVKQKILDPPPKLPTLPSIDLPQVDTVPVYRPSRPNLNFGEELKKKAPEAPPPMLKSADITSRKTKSVMYTGKKNFSGVVTSLYQMCMRVLIENVDALYETGGVPFSVLEPLLTKCSPAQLERLEYYNPHFIQDSDQLWKRHCEIEFKGKKIDEDSVGAWRDMYKELLSEREERLRRLSNKIVLNQAQKIPERSVKLAFVGMAPKASAQVARVQRKKEKERDYRQKEIEKEKDNQKEIRDRMMKEQQASSDVVVPFTKVPRRDRCSKRPPSSLSCSNLHPEPKKPKPKDDDELGSHGPAEFMPTPKKKKAKNPMMLKAMKLLNKQKSRMGAQIMRK